jgi:hypothetical protein
MNDFIPSDAPIWEKAKHKMYAPIGTKAYYWDAIDRARPAAQKMEVITKELALDWLGHPGRYSTVWERVKWCIKITPFLLKKHWE